MRLMNLKNRLPENETISFSANQADEPDGRNGCDLTGKSCKLERFYSRGLSANVMQKNEVE